MANDEFLIGKGDEQPSLRETGEIIVPDTPARSGRKRKQPQPIVVVPKTRSNGRAGKPPATLLQKLAKPRSSPPRPKRASESLPANVEDSNAGAPMALVISKKLMELQSLSLAVGRNALESQAEVMRTMVLVRTIPDALTVYGNLARLQCEMLGQWAELVRTAFSPPSCSAPSDLIPRLEGSPLGARGRKTPAQLTAAK